MNRVFTLTLMLLCSCNELSNNKGVSIGSIESEIEQVSEWDIFYEALIQVESEGNPKAIGKTNDAGIIQITPIYVRDVNRILGKDKYTYDCRFSPELSREMFDMLQSHYNKDKCIKKAIKLHNPKAGKWYADRIYKEMDKIRLSYEK